MDEKKEIGRREFLGKATLSAVVAASVTLGVGQGKTNAEDRSSTDSKKIVPKMKKIALEEHWSSNQELIESRIDWGNRTKYPTTVDPKALGYAVPRTPDFEKFRIPFMDQYDIDIQVLSIGSQAFRAMLMRLPP